MTTTPVAWVWVRLDVLHAVHAEQLAEHGGLPGVRDPYGLESAVARAENREHYVTPDAADLAAAYGFGVARNHPFIEGNKRTAFVAVEVFFRLNRLELTAGDADCVLTMLAVASGDLSEPA